MLFICHWLLFVKVMQSRHDVKWNVNFVWASHCYAQKEGWPRCRIYIYNYSHDTIISHHNSSARDVSSDREQASHSAYQTAAWQAWAQRFRPSDLHHAKSDSLSSCVPLILSVCLCLSLCSCFSRCLSLLVSQSTER